MVIGNHLGLGEVLGERTRAANEKPELRKPVVIALTVISDASRPSFLILNGRGERR